MNHSLAVFLINSQVRLIEVDYEPSSAKGPVPYNGHHVKFKCIDPTIKVDDYVIVQSNTRWGYTVAKVRAVDLRVNYGDPTEVFWAQRVDVPEFERILALEKGAVDAIAKADERKQREELARVLLNDAPELAGNELFNRLSAPPPVSPPPAPPRARAVPADVLGRTTSPDPDDEIPF